MVKTVTPFDATEEFVRNIIFINGGMALTTISGALPATANPPETVLHGARMKS